MSRWRCNCGEPQRDGGDPDSRRCLVAFPRTVVERWMDTGTGPKYDEDTPCAVEVWKCAACGRLHLIDEQNRLTQYVPEPRDP